jgi:hypothetical protein
MEAAHLAFFCGREPKCSAKLVVDTVRTCARIEKGQNALSGKVWRTLRGKRFQPNINPESRPDLRKKVGSRLAELPDLNPACAVRM